MKKKIFFLVFSIAFLSLAYSVLTQGSGGGGMPAFGGGCWNFNTEQTCTNTSDEYGCRWNEFMGGGGTGPIGWCEEKGCWSYWNSNDCTAAGCSWDPQGFCYKKGCWDNSNSTTCENANCSWQGYGYCYEVNCWDFNKQSTCLQSNVTNNITCRWNDMGTMDTTDDYCYEVGPWEYTANTSCDQAGFTWGSQGGWCSEIGCWNFNTKNICNAADGCSWEGWDNCRNRGCQDFDTQPECEGVEDEFNCTWDSNYNYCKQIGCWNYNSQPDCDNTALHPTLTCQWNSNNLYCYEPFCSDYTTQDQCNAHPSDNCYWDSQWNNCRERGCWDFWQNETYCENNDYEMDCNWKINGYCYMPGCWYYNTSDLCGAHSDKCRWDGQYCSEKGCWDYTNQTSCIDVGNTIHSEYDCRWQWYNDSAQGLGGWCNKPECWNYVNETNCTSDTDEITCSWDANNKFCYKKGCWDYHDQTNCTDVGDTIHPDVTCSWDGQNCYEQGCWNYWQNQTYCESNSCLWQIGGGWCEQPLAGFVDCWSFKDNATCSVNSDECVWESYGGCNKEGCWKYGNQLDCEAHAIDKRCGWDSTYNNCYEKGCWDYKNQTSCIGSDCLWDPNGWCYQEGCWKYNANDTCSNVSDTLTCKWEAHEYCYEQGCWDYTTNDTCESNDCRWQQSGWCEGGSNCWNYYNNETVVGCEAYPGCVWKTSGWCDRRGPWVYQNNETCADAGFLWKLEGGWCNENSTVSCWNWNFNQDECEAQTACKWENPNCVKRGCWEYGVEGECSIAPEALNCQWKNETFTSTGWCEEIGCWNFWQKQNCTEAMTNYELNCMWQTFGFCQEKNCWMYNSAGQCNNLTDTIDCSWQGQTEGRCETPPCWGYKTNETCLATNGCNWAQGNPDYCYYNGTANCWNASSDNNTCLTNGCVWFEPGWCEGKYGPSECWEYSNSTACNADVENCQWKTGSCNEKGCWSYMDNEGCINGTLHPSMNCSWHLNEFGPGGWCEELGCWNYWQNSSICENNPANLECQWHAESWNPQGGWCEELGCWNHWDELSCSIDSDCQWNQDPSGFGGWCSEKGCWSKTGKSDCESDGNCSWKTESHCELTKCWMFDNKTLQGQAMEEGCVNNSYGLNCTWDPNGGWCNEYNAGCAAHDGDREACKWTGFCMWNEANQTCDSPGQGWLDEMHEEKDNPGCWIFDYEESYCDEDMVDICTWGNSTGECTTTKDTGHLGIQCLNIKDSTLCEKIPVLSTCCVWKNNKCQADASGTKCWENFRQPPAGATFCEDTNAYKDQSVCEEIAGDPWYMPCKWDDKGTSDSSDDSCAFRKEDKFGGEDKGCEGITSKKDCDFAGCTWKQEYYCEEGKAVPSGWCEEKVGAGSKSCDAECWACEFYDSSGTAVNSTNAQSACENSALGYCEFSTDSKAPNGIGFCQMKNEVKFGGGDCSANCKSCEYKSSPQTACEQSPAQCKWVTDTTGMATAGGYCFPSTEKTCNDDCFRCYTETECMNYGGGSKGTCTWDSSTKICKPKNFDKEICFDGFDNDGDGNYDCGDSDCLSDPFCGAGSTSNCWMYSENECKNSTISGEECIWIVDPYEGKSWCGHQGENCFLWDGNPAGCMNQTGLCNWFNHSSTDSNAGMCDINGTKIQSCFKSTTQGGCVMKSDCTWTQDSTSQTGGRCEPKITKCEVKTQTQCESGEWSSICKWAVEDGQGKCKPTCLTNQLGVKSLCEANQNCLWMTGWCDPAEELGMNSEDCWKYDDNSSLCENAKACMWKGEGSFCDINGTRNLGCQQMKSMDSCTNVPQCKWNGDQWNGWCDAKIFACGWYQNNASCVEDGQGYGGCIWRSPCECMWGVSPEHPQGCEVLCRNAITQGTCNVTAGCQWTNKPEHCEPKCFDMGIGECNAQGGGWCELIEGRCEPKFEMEMFGDMKKPVDLGRDDSGCGSGSLDEQTPDELDICGFGLIEEPDKLSIGLGVDSLVDAAMCNGEEIAKSFGPNTPSITIADSGTGKNTTKYYWYLGTDGSEIGGCPLYHDSSKVGYEFFFKYVVKWENGNLVELKSAYRCEDGEWVIIPGDLKLSTWSTMACSEMGGPIIIIQKSDLNRFPDLYKPWEKMRIYIASGRTIESSPTDTIGPGVYTPGTLGTEANFEVKGFSQQGFIKGEDCFNGIDDNYNDMIDCNDPDCRSASNCQGIGVNSGDYTDDTTPSLTNYKVEKFLTSAFIKYDTDEPTNGTVEFYYNESDCSGSNSTGKNRLIYDRGIIDPVMEDYKNWHDGPIDNYAFNPQKIGYDLENGTTYYYKIKFCDPSGNCGFTGCLNFTTPSSTKKSDCPMCSATIKIPPNMMIDFGGGGGYETYDDVASCGGTGVQKNNSELMSVKIAMNGSGGGQVIFENTTIIDPDIGSPEIIDNTTTIGGYEVGYVGMDTGDFNNLTSKISPGVCIVPVPRGSGGDCDYLWQCDTPENGVLNESTCHIVDAILVDSTDTHCEWKLRECKFSVYRADTEGAATTTTTVLSGPGGGAGGAGGAGTTTIATTVPGATTTLPTGATTTVLVTTTVPVGKEGILPALPQVMTGIPTTWIVAVVIVIVMVVVGIILAKKTKTITSGV